MEKLTEEQIKDIADSVNAGFSCFLNPVTFEYVLLPDEDQMIDSFDEDEDPWLEERQKIEAWDESVSIEGMESRESFKVMENFADNIPDSDPLKGQIFQALNRRSPFRNFKDIVESSDYRDEWFEYRGRRFLEHTSDQIEAIIHRDDDGWNEIVYNDDAEA